MPTVLERIYSSPLTPTLYLGITRDMNENLNVGAVFHSELYRNRLHSSLTFSGNAGLTKNIFGSASYTIQNGQWNNLGLGIGVKMGYMHFHVISTLNSSLSLHKIRNKNS